MTEEIKPCPFCGNKSGIGEVELVKNMKTASALDRNLFKITCWQCGAESGAKDSEEYAVWQWNQRPYDFDMPAIVKKVQHLELQNEKMKAALKIYANHNEWSSEACFEYETGKFLATGNPETDTGSVDLDGDFVWAGYGDNGYELAELTLKELEPCKQPE